MCECGNPDCSQILLLTRNEYTAVRAHPAQFVVMPGHEIEGAEVIVGHHRHAHVIERLVARAKMPSHKTPAPEQLAGGATVAYRPRPSSFPALSVMRSTTSKPLRH
jgi:hypothetical protein